MKPEMIRQFGKRYWKYAVLVLLAAALVVLCCVRGKQARVDDTPLPSRAEQQADRAQTLLDAMTTREKICQLLIVSPEALTENGEAVTELKPELSAMLQEYPVGGLILSIGNLETREQTVRLVSDLQSASATKLFICADEEGGQVGRLMYTIGTTKLDSMFSYRALGTQTAYDNAVTLATDLQSCGFNVDFAPVADVWSNPDNTVIGNRAYSDDYDEAAELVAAAVQGFRDSNVICCLKHFPGHGSTETDSHEQSAIVDKTLHTLLQEDLKPFISGMEAGADMVMVGHLTVPSMDEQPASMSYKLVTSLLRRQMTYRGVIITDGLQMQALGDYTDAEKAVRCLQAGVDVLLGIEDVPGAVAAVEQAITDGTLTQEQIDASVLRVLNLKLSHGILPISDTE